MSPIDGNLRFWTAPPKRPCKKGPHMTSKPPNVISKYWSFYQKSLKYYFDELNGSSVNDLPVLPLHPSLSSPLVRENILDGFFLRTSRCLVCRVSLVSAPSVDNELEQDHHPLIQFDNDVWFITYDCMQSEFGMEIFEFQTVSIIRFGKQEHFTN